MSSYISYVLLQVLQFYCGLHLVSICRVGFIDFARKIHLNVEGWWQLCQPNHNDFHDMLLLSIPNNLSIVKSFKIFAIYLVIMYSVEILKYKLWIHKISEIIIIWMILTLVANALLLRNSSKTLNNPIIRFKWVFGSFYRQALSLISCKQCSSLTTYRIHNWPTFFI